MPIRTHNHPAECGSTAEKDDRRTYLINRFQNITLQRHQIKFVRGGGGVTRNDNQPPKRHDPDGTISIYHITHRTLFKRFPSLTQEASLKTQTPFQKLKGVPRNRGRKVSTEHAPSMRTGIRRRRRLPPPPIRHFITEPHHSSLNNIDSFRRKLQCVLAKGQLP